MDIESSPWQGMPTTRFQGSKRKLLPVLHSVFSDLSFESCLDAFGGTGSVSFLLKQMNKKVTYNDIMPSSVVMARALLTNKSSLIPESTLLQLFQRRDGMIYKDTVGRTFENIYFTDEENSQIDVFCQNLRLVDSLDWRNQAFYLFAQSLLSKRPYNLFHRANLDMRLKNVKRSFGNKVTWDKPIVEHCFKFFKELQTCRDSRSCFEPSFLNESAFDLESKDDLVYIDTPYAKSKGTQESNYFNFYHFLDALLMYPSIESSVDKTVKHRPFYEVNKRWYPTDDIDLAFKKLFWNFRKSKLVISYRSDGHPTVERLMEILRATHRLVSVIDVGRYKYALSTRQTESKEVVIVAA